MLTTADTFFTQILMDVAVPARIRHRFPATRALSGREDVGLPERAATACSDARRNNHLDEQTSLCTADVPGTDPIGLQ